MAKNGGDCSPSVWTARTRRLMVLQPLRTREWTHSATTRGYSSTAISCRIRSSLISEEAKVNDSFNSLASDVERFRSFVPKRQKSPRAELRSRFACCGSRANR